MPLDRMLLAASLVLLTLAIACIVALPTATRQLERRGRRSGSQRLATPVTARRGTDEVHEPRELSRSLSRSAQHCARGDGDPLLLSQLDVAHDPHRRHRRNTGSPPTHAATPPPTHPPPSAYQLRSPSATANRARRAAGHESSFPVPPPLLNWTLGVSSMTEHRGQVLPAWTRRGESVVKLWEAAPTRRLKRQRSYCSAPEAPRSSL
jgi:hypothetical protein